MIKLALVDDDPRLLNSLKLQLLQFSEIGSVMTSTNGLGFAVELGLLAPEDRPEVVIMDISMELPEEGIPAAKKIKQTFPEIEIIMFTISDRDDLIFEAFKAGAMGYLLKNESPEFIVKAIVDVKNGDAQMSPAIARKTIGYLVGNEKNIHPPAEPAETLSPRELEILQLVAKGYTYHHISGLLSIAQSTVKKHMTNIFEKLHVRNKIEALLKTGEYRLPDGVGSDLKRE